MSGHRRAAVALHGLTEEDRRLILDQLPVTDQSTLRGYLAELAELGFDRDSTGIDMPAAAAQPPLTMDLAQASPAMMLALLGQEPAALVAQVLALEDWCWRTGLLALLTPARREAVQSVRVIGAPARDRFLRQSLASRLRQLVPQPTPVASNTSWLAALRQRVRAWR